MRAVLSRASSTFSVPPPVARRSSAFGVLSALTLPFCAGLLVVVIVAHLWAQAPPPRPVFRGGTDLIEVDVSVLDHRRAPVRGLTAADFTVFEDGHLREIQAFTEVNLPDRVQTQDASWLQDVPHDVVTNQAVRDEGRLVIIWPTGRFRSVNRQWRRDGLPLRS